MGSSLVRNGRRCFASKNLNHRSVLNRDYFYTSIVGAVPAGAVDGGGHRVGAARDGPFSMEEEIRARHGRHPLRIVAIVNGSVHWDAGFAENAGLIAEVREDGVAGANLIAEKIGRLASPGPSGDRVHL